MLVLERVIVHDSKSIVKRGIIELLLMNIEESPFLMEENWKVDLVHYEWMYRLVDEWINGCID